MKTRMSEVGSPATFVELPGLGHNETAVRIGMDGDPVMPTLLDFFRRAGELRGRPALPGGALEGIPAAQRLATSVCSSVTCPPMSKRLMRPTKTKAFIRGSDTEWSSVWSERCSERNMVIVAPMTGLMLS